MSQTRPYRKDVNWIQGDTLEYQFTFLQDSSVWDLSGKSEITVILTKNRTLTEIDTDNEWKQTLTGGDLTLSGAGNNVISGTASASEMSLASRKYYFVIYFNNSIKETQVVYTVNIIDGDSGNSSPSIWEIDIDTSTGALSGQAGEAISYSSLDSKSTPVSADSVKVFDSEDSNSDKRSTLAQLKRAVLGYREVFALFIFSELDTVDQYVSGDQFEFDSIDTSTGTAVVFTPIEFTNPEDIVITISDYDDVDGKSPNFSVKSTGANTLRLDWTPSNEDSAEVYINIKFLDTPMQIV